MSRGTGAGNGDGVGRTGKSPTRSVRDGSHAHARPGWFPIQVKQSDLVGTFDKLRAGRPDIDAFQVVMEREGEGGRGSTELAEVQRGFFVAFGYSRDAEQECAALHKRPRAGCGSCSE